MFVPSRLEDVFHLNYDLQSQIFEDQLNGWKHGIVSWTGRISTLKRKVLHSTSYFYTSCLLTWQINWSCLWEQRVEYHWRVKCCIVSQLSKRFQLAGFKYWCWREHYDIWAASLTTKDIWLHLINSIGHCLKCAQDSPKRNSLALLLLKSVT